MRRSAPRTKRWPRKASSDARRVIPLTTPWVATPKRDDPPWLPLGGAFAGASALGLVATALERRRRKPAVAAKAAPSTPAANKRLPVIDTSTCLGCYACVDACPF